MDRLVDAVRALIRRLADVGCRREAERDSTRCGASV